MAKARREREERASQPWILTIWMWHSQNKVKIGCGTLPEKYRPFWESSIKVFWSDWNTFWTSRTVFRALYTFFEYRHFSTEIQNSLSKQCAPWVLWSFHLEFSATPHLNKNLRTQKYSFRRCVQFFCELLTFIIREDRAFWKKWVPTLIFLEIPWFFGTHHSTKDFSPIAYSYISTHGHAPAAFHHCW